MKKFIFTLVLCSLVVLITGCSNSTKEVSDTNKINVTATLFPQYDFATNIAKEKATVKLLLPPGTESHTYEPTPSDMMNIASSKLVFYTGKYMEPWSDKLISGFEESSTKIVDVSNGITLIKQEHDHSYDEESSHENSEHHIDQYDPHIWLDLTLACKMVDNIKDAFCSVDSKSKSFYEKNAEDYKKRLLVLDQEFKNVVLNGKRKKIVFGGRFAHIYFVKRYGLEYKSAFDSCSTEMDPGVKKVTSIIEYIKENNIPCIYYEELSEPKVALSIAEQTGISTFKFSTAHNLSKEQINSGVSFLDVMKENLENLKFGLN